MPASTAFSFVFANFGIAIAARMPMMTTTIRSSIRVKPLRFRIISFLGSGYSKGSRSGRADGAEATHVPVQCSGAEGFRVW